ncbi:MAG: hypothetical protein U0271_26845 [Polyangiaceae bacterium]
MANEEEATRTEDRGAEKASAESPKAGDSKEPEQKEGVPWREILPDKAIDVVLIPLGLFAALWFQGWVDDRKEQEDYVTQLESFQGEIAVNREKVGAMESQLGALDQQAAGQSLGPLGEIFPAYDRSMEWDTKLLGCLEMLYGPSEKAMTEAELKELAKTEDGRAEIEANLKKGEAAAAKAEKCQKIIAGEARPPEVALKIVDLSPLYRYEVWQMYLQDGIKLFKDEPAKKLGQQLGEVYAMAKEIESRIGEIEDAYNNELTTQYGAQSGINAEVEELLDSVEPGAEAAARFHSLGREMQRSRYALMSFRDALDARVARVKALVQEMNQRFDTVTSAIQAEVASHKR